MEYFYKMKKTCLIGCFILFVIFTYGQNIPKLYKKCLPAIVNISVLGNDGIEGHGTGFFINQNTIITCYHVVDNANTIEIQTSTGKKFTIDSVISSNKKSDLIKFTVKEKNTTWLPLSDKLPKIGESAFVIGNPQDYDFSMSNGIVSSIRIKNSTEIIQTTAPCSPGNSGSPILNKKGNVIGVLSYVKLIGQNLNFAATSLNVINMQNDKTIKLLSPNVRKISKTEMDSLINVAKRYSNAKDYNSALNIILPITRISDTSHLIEFTEIIAKCHFFNKDYSKAVQYYEVLIDRLHENKKHTAEDVLTFTQALHNSSMCYYILGDIEGAIDVAAKAAEVCKTGLEMDTTRKEIYTLLIQQIYMSDSLFKYSLNKTFEACLSWKIAKQYGYKQDDYGFENICK